MIHENKTSYVLVEGRENWAELWTIHGFAKKLQFILSFSVHLYLKYLKLT